MAPNHEPKPPIKCYESKVIVLLMKFNKEPMFLKSQAHPRFLYVTVTVDLLFTIVGKSCFIRYVRYV